MLVKVFLIDVIDVECWNEEHPFISEHLLAFSPTITALTSRIAIQITSLSDKIDLRYRDKGYGIAGCCVP